VRTDSGVDSQRCATFTERPKLRHDILCGRPVTCVIAATLQFAFRSAPALKIAARRARRATRGRTVREEQHLSRLGSGRRVAAALRSPLHRRDRPATGSVGGAPGWCSPHRDRANTSRARPRMMPPCTACPWVVTLGLLLVARVLAPESMQPVARHSPQTLATEFGEGFILVDAVRCEQLTPRGSTQMFQYSRLLRVF
jgi:hypothetical protein